MFAPYRWRPRKSFFGNIHPNTVDNSRSQHNNQLDRVCWCSDYSINSTDNFYYITLLVPAQTNEVSYHTNNNNYYYYETLFQVLLFCRSWTLPGTHNTYVIDNIKTPAYDLCDAETKYEPEMVGNNAYGTSTFKASVKENVAYGAVDSQGLTSENAAYGTSANDVPSSENASTTKTNDDGPVYDSVD